MFSDEGWKARRRSPEQETHTDIVGGWSDSTLRFDTLTIDFVITKIKGFAVGLYHNNSNNNRVKRMVHLFWVVTSCWRKNTLDYWLLPLPNHKANSTATAKLQLIYCGPSVSSSGSLSGTSCLCIHVYVHDGDWRGNCGKRHGLGNYGGYETIKGQQIHPSHLDPITVWWPLMGWNRKLASWGDCYELLCSCILNPADTHKANNEKRLHALCQGHK